MARSDDLLRGVHGIIGPIIVKQYTGKTVITSVPRMRNLRRTKKQKTNSSRFADAVIYAQGIISDPVIKRQFADKLKKGQSVYHAALREYMLMHSE